ncbi:branched-chain amino acid ABC transporter permease [Candidatus Puniceispirillum marinum]|uniref:ABC-type branched-chain amino acid transport system permease component n=1 Tax=Puniceispirillum marinum (strain IMCC1322) TaxID=488538 RepID=D5BMI7_PUNMI|nr:branched-chain amino acid ABC transporter permease [Candidatus Puniceispirillum marinum]ADE40030.1 ABC-type branched-chain amino acid transport system permease component [Candidatus Puniceispirillum marinum IMCC1322]
MTRFSRSRHALMIMGLVFLLFLPLFADQFWLTQIATRALLWGIIAISLSFLASYLGVVSFAQMTLAGIAGYTIAYFGPNTVENVGVLLPWPVTVILALLFATLAGALLGLICRRSTGIYAIMITLAIGMTFFFLTRQNYSLLNGWNGFAGLDAPIIAGIDISAPVPFYFLVLAVALFASLLIEGFIKSPLGLVIQAVRDNPERVMSVGIPSPPAIITAYAVSGLIAGMGGVLLVWYYGRISSFSVGLDPILDVLIIAVIGGLRKPSGAFVGALIFVLIDVFAIDLISQDRFNTVIGLVLLLIMIMSPQGLSGMAGKMLHFFDQKQVRS